MSERSPPELSFKLGLFSVTAKGNTAVKAVKRPITAVLFAMAVLIIALVWKAELPTLSTLKSYVPSSTWLSSLGRQ